MFAAGELSGTTPSFSSRFSGTPVDAGADGWVRMRNFTFDGGVDDYREGGFVDFSGGE